MVAGVCVCVFVCVCVHDLVRFPLRRFNDPTLEMSYFVSHRIMLCSTDIPSLINGMFILFIM